MNNIYYFSNLGVHLLDFDNGGKIVKEVVKSSFGVEVNKKQVFDPILMHIKDDVGH